MVPVFFLILVFLNLYVMYRRAYKAYDSKTNSHVPTNQVKKWNTENILVAICVSLPLPRDNDSPDFKSQL